MHKSNPQPGTRNFLSFFCCRRVRIASSDKLLSQDTTTSVTQPKNGIFHHLTQENASTFQALLSEKKLSARENQALFDYLDTLLGNQASVELFESAIDFMCRTRQILHLSNNSLAFLHELCKKNKQSYSNLMTLIAKRAPIIFLKQHHLDAVIDIFLAQRELAPNAEEIVRRFSSEIDVPLVVSLIQQKYFPEIVTQSVEQNLLHHTLKHAAEIKVRAKHVIDKLNLLDVSRQPFLRSLTKFAIEGHDLKQRNSLGYPTVELATAAQLQEWLFNALSLDEVSSENKVIRDYIHLVLHKIIVLGTTMIFSRESTLDLSELFYWVESAAEDAGMNTCDPTNRALMHKLDLIALLTGVCDKTPSALFDVVSKQARHPATNSLARLKAFYPDSVLACFMNDGAQFQSYFRGASLEVNQQAFMMGLVPHLCMRAELAAAKINDPAAKPFEISLAEKAIVFIQFIDSCQKLFSTDDLLMYEGNTYLSFNDYFQDRFLAQKMGQYVDDLFFSMLIAEIQFCQSQTDSLSFVKRRLIECSYVADNDVFINPRAPAIDAQNLFGLGLFYQRLKAKSREQLSRELVLNVIMQAGAAYLVEPSLETPSEPSSPALDVSCSTTVSFA